LVLTKPLLDGTVVQPTLGFGSFNSAGFSGGDVGGGGYFVPLEFRYGEPFTFSISLSTGAKATGDPRDGDESFANAYFAKTAFWQGLSNLTAEDYGPVTTWTIESASGTNWALPFVTNVDEPPLHALMALGIGALVCLRRFRRLKRAYSRL
jgi:hypothetical protein